MTQDLAHKRPWLFASLIFGLSFPFSWQLALPDPAAIAWKMAGVGLLTGYALRKHHSGEFLLLATVMAFWALGDGLLELDMVWGAIAFAIGHLVAIALFLRHRRVHPVFSQKLLALALLVVAPIIAFYLPADRMWGMQAAIYTLFVAGMAACAWNSNFPRYRVGIGAVAVRRVRPADLRAHGAAFGKPPAGHADLAALLLRAVADLHRRHDDTAAAGGLRSIPRRPPLRHPRLHRLRHRHHRPVSRRLRRVPRQRR